MNLTSNMNIAQIHLQGYIFIRTKKYIHINIVPIFLSKYIKWKISVHHLRHGRILI